MLLTLDLGEHLGWTKGPMDADAGPKSVSFGTLPLRATSHLGRFVRSALNEIPQLMEGVTAMAVEKPDTMGNSYFGIRKNMALLGVAWMIADKYGIGEVSEISVTSAKLRLAGSGKAGKTEMIHAAQAFGFKVTDDHQADALGIRLVVLLGKAETKAEREKREAGERRAAREAEAAAKKGPALL